jgi:hypothetical protein
MNSRQLELVGVILDGLRRVSLEDRAIYRNTALAMTEKPDASSRERRAGEVVLGVLNYIEKTDWDREAA